MAERPPLRQGWLAALLALAICGFYGPQIAPTVTTAYGGADGGELATAVWAGAVPHPPGYPTYLLFGRVALLLPAGEPAWRLGWLSTLALASAAAILVLLTPLLSQQSLRFPQLSGLLAAAVLALDRRVWEQALIVEVYALALLMLALLLWLTARWQRYRRRRTLLALGLVLGLGIWVQLPLLAWLAGAAWLAWCSRPWRWRAAVALFGAGLLLGLSVVLVLPWRGQARPGASWGDWTSLSGMLAHISAAEYRYLVGVVPWAQRAQRLVFVLVDLVRSLGLLGAPLALIGLVWGAALPGWRGLSALIAASVVGWSVSYGGSDSTVYLLPLHLLGALWAGLGFEVALGWLGAGFRWRIGAVVGLLLVLAPALQLSQRSLGTATAERELARQRLSAAPPFGQIVSQDDQITFPLWYVQSVLGVRPDVQVIDERLLDRPWYQRRWPCPPAAPGPCGR